MGTFQPGAGPGLFPGALSALKRAPEGRRIIDRGGAQRNPGLERTTTPSPGRDGIKSWGLGPWSFDLAKAMPSPAVTTDKMPVPHSLPPAD